MTKCSEAKSHLGPCICIELIMFLIIVIKPQTVLVLALDVLEIQFKRNKFVISHAAL